MRACSNYDRYAEIIAPFRGNEQDNAAEKTAYRRMIHGFNGLKMWKYGKQLYCLPYFHIIMMTIFYEIK